MTSRSRDGLVRITRDCWVDAAAVDDLSARCAAVLDAVGPDCVISSVTAARLHGLWLPDVGSRVHVATATPGRVGRHMTRARRDGFVAHRLQFADDDVVDLRGVLVTSPARTWRDLAAVLDLPALVAAGDSVLRLGTAPEVLADLVERTSHSRHARLARTALHLLDARSRSRPESHLRVAISAPDLPRFEVNAPVYRDEGGWLAEPDLSLAEARIALEYQGDVHAGLRRMRSDITRGRDLRMAGWVGLLYRPAEVFGRPWSIAPELRSLVAERAPHLLRRGGRRTRVTPRVVSQRREWSLPTDHSQA